MQSTQNHLLSDVFEVKVAAEAKDSGGHGDHEFRQRRMDVLRTRRERWSFRHDRTQALSPKHEAHHEELSLDVLRRKAAEVNFIESAKRVGTRVRGSGVLEKFSRSCARTPPSRVCRSSTVSPQRPTTRDRAAERIPRATSSRAHPRGESTDRPRVCGLSPVCLWPTEALARPILSLCPGTTLLCSPLC